MTNLDLVFLKRMSPEIPPENLVAHEEYVRYHRRRFGVSLEMLAPVSLKGARVLSVGLEPGYFEGYLASEYGCHMSGTELPKHHPVGYEYDIVFHDARRGTVVTIPMTMSHAGVDPLPFRDTTFDVVLFLEVIEHMLCKPDFAFTELRRVSKPGAHLLLTTPNAQHWHRLAFLLEGRRYPDTDFSEDLSHRHHQLFSMMELRNLLRQAGFSIVNERYEDCYDLAAGASIDNSPVLRALAGRPEFQKENIFILARRVDQ